MTICWKDGRDCWLGKEGSNNFVGGRRVACGVECGMNSWLWGCRSIMGE